MKKAILFVSLIVAMLTQTQAQELYCNVQVNARQVEGTEKQVFEDLRGDIFEFINNRVWTSYEFKIEERIECNILITISERVSSEEFKGNLTIALNRPAYSSTYGSMVLNYIDNDIQFKYSQGQPFDYADNAFISNLSSIVAYYVYIALGFDFDTFALYAGDPYFEKAEEIVSVAQSETYPGWKAYEGDKNRYWLVENLLNPSYKPIRKFLYEYHRKGIDMMFESQELGRKNITKALQSLEKVYDSRPGLFLVQLMVDAKRTELIQIFSEGSSNEKNQVVNILSKIDPAHTSDYEDILKN
jgi:Domain of unknown function (DUF4835)